MVTVSDVERVYSGRSGCMCGCQGTYRETPRAKSMALKKMLAGEYSVCAEANCIYIDDGKRNNVIYFKEGVELPEAPKRLVQNF